MELKGAFIGTIQMAKQMPAELLKINQIVEEYWLNLNRIFPAGTFSKRLRHISIAYIAFYNCQYFDFVIQFVNHRP